MLSAQTKDAVTARGGDAAVQGGAHAADDGEAAGEGDRAADLSGQLLSEQGGARQARPASRSCRATGAACPTTMEELLTLPGVGRKTANLVLILAHASPRQHLRRHARPSHFEPARLGRDAYARGNRARALRGGRPAWWPVINLYLVTWGQNVCRPVYPLCGTCVLFDLCPRIGVTRVGKAVSVARHSGGPRQRWLGGLRKGYANAHVRRCLLHRRRGFRAEALARAPARSSCWRPRRGLSSSRPTRKKRRRQSRRSSDW